MKCLKAFSSIRSRIVGFFLILLNYSAYSQIIPYEVKQLVRQAGANQPYGTGFSVAVVDNGKVKFSTGGGNGVDIDGDSKFLLASVTKQLTAAAIVSLYQEGKLDFEDSITKYVPEFLNWRAIKIRNLLQNNTSLVDFLGTPIYQPTSRSTSDFEILSALHASTPGVPSGCIRYSNSNFILLSLIVERVSGMSFGRYLDEAIFIPLKMFDTEYRGGVIANDVQVGHNQRNFPNVVSYYREWASGAGGVISTANDMAKWLIAVSKGFKNIKNLIPRETAQGACLGSEINKYGLGWQVDSESEIYHSGMAWGYASFDKINTRSGKGVVVLSNAEIVAGPKIKQFAETVLSLSNNPGPRRETENNNFGSYCCTQFGKFGPHPTQRHPVGVACTWSVYNSIVPGIVCN